MQYKNANFDLMPFRYRTVVHIEDDYGNKKELQCDERCYVPSEITWLLKAFNFRTIGIHGARLGAFSRNDTLTTGDSEMPVIAER